MDGNRIQKQGDGTEGGIQESENRSQESEARSQNNKAENRFSDE
jgi:hypothetical protein